METVTLRLPATLLQNAARVAHGEDVTVGHLVRVLLAREVDRRLNPKTPNRADETLLAALQALLARDMAEAEDWTDLAQRLARHGYELRPAGGGLALHKSSCGSRICKGSELGFAYRTLVARFQAAMPGHPHGAMGLLPGADSAPIDSTRKGRLQRALTPIFKSAGSWHDLINRLEQAGYELRPHGRGMAIYTVPQGRHLCNTATVGYRHRALVKRFGGPMPGLGKGSDQRVEDDDLDVIERSI